MKAEKSRYAQIQASNRLQVPASLQPVEVRGIQVDLFALNGASGRWIERSFKHETRLDLAAAIGVVTDELECYFDGDSAIASLAPILRSAHLAEGIEKAVNNQYEKESAFRAECQTNKAFSYLCAFVRQWVARQLRHLEPTSYAKLPPSFRVGLPIDRRRGSPR